MENSLDVLNTATNTSLPLPPLTLESPIFYYSIRKCVA